MKTIGKYSFGIGDRFAHEGVNQLKALGPEDRPGIRTVTTWGILISSRANVKDSIFFANFSG